MPPGPRRPVGGRGNRGAAGPQGRSAATLPIQGPGTPVRPVRARAADEDEQTIDRTIHQGHPLVPMMPWASSARTKGGSGSAYPSQGVHSSRTLRSSSGKQAAPSTSVARPQDRMRTAPRGCPRCRRSTPTVPSAPSRSNRGTPGPPPRNPGSRCKPETYPSATGQGPAASGPEPRADVT